MGDGQGAIDSESVWLVVVWDSSDMGCCSLRPLSWESGDGGESGKVVGVYTSRDARPLPGLGDTLVVGVRRRGVINFPPEKLPSNVRAFGDIVPLVGYLLWRDAGQALVQLDTAACE